MCEVWAWGPGGCGTLEQGLCPAQPPGGLYQHGPLQTPDPRPSLGLAPPAPPRQTSTRSPRGRGPSLGGAWLPADLGKQCAAVSTHCGAMSEPPHTCVPRCWMLACHGHSPARASRPPTIRLDTRGCPQAGRTRGLGVGRAVGDGEAGGRGSGRLGPGRQGAGSWRGRHRGFPRLPYLQMPGSRLLLEVEAG